MVAYDWTCVVNPNPTYCNFHVMPGEARIVPRCGCYICNACCNYISCCPAHQDSLIRPSTLQFQARAVRMVAYDWTCVVNPNPTYKCIYCNFHVMPGEARIVPRCGCYICNACCNYISCCPAHQDSLIRPSTLQETSLEISQAISNVNVRCLYHLDGCLWGGSLGAANGYNSSCPNRYTPRLPPVHLCPFAAKLREILHTTTVEPLIECQRMFSEHLS